MIKTNCWKKVLVLMVVGVIVLTVAAQAEPKNVIFFIGDGMGFAQVEAAGMYANGLEGTLSFESFPYNGELTTYSANAEIPDSAAAGTALATGVKVNNGVISMAYPGDQSELETLLEHSKAQGKSTGLVTTVYVTHATPAAFGAHEQDRNNYSQIANDYLTQTRPNLIFGGELYMDNAGSSGYTVVTNRDEMLDYYDASPDTMLSGQFYSGDLPYVADYNYASGTIPSLSEMTDTALSILDNDTDGFFLMVEGGNIDHACHDNHTQRTIYEVVEFANAVQVAIDWAAGRNDTLILVCADHETGKLTVLANNGAGVLPTVDWDSTGHTAANVPVYAWGVNAELISGVMDNTDMFGVVTADTSPQASNPSPADGADVVDINADLSWTAGAGAINHDVYFGPNSTNLPLVSEGQTQNTYDPGILTIEITYYWRIDEFDGNTTHTGTVWSFTTASSPGQADNPSPTNGATNVGVDSDLSWTAGSDTTSHDVYFGINPTPGTAEFKGNQTGATFDPVTMDYITTYYWRIDEVGPGGITEGIVWSFTTIIEAPGQASSPSPSNGATGVAVDANLVWTAGAGATSHDVYFGTSSPGTFQGNQTETTFDPGTMAYNKTYYWRIDEKNAGGTTAGQVWSFITTVAPPGQASNPSPADGAPGVAIEAVLSWTAGSGAISHDVYLGTDYHKVISASESSSEFLGNQTETSYDPDTLEPGMIYYWRIDEKNAGGTTTGTVWSFTTAALPGQASNPSPANGVTGVDVDADLSWTAGSGTTSHDVYFGVSDPPPLIRNQAVTTYDPGTLMYETTYYWRIDEVGPGGVMPGNVWSFKTEDIPEDVDVPASSETDVDGTRTGTYINTQASDNSYEEIEEVVKSRNKNFVYSALEHKWIFNVTSGNLVTFHIEAHKSASSDGDDFVFAYSTDDSTYTNMLTVTKTADDNTYQTYTLPASISGTVYIRVQDTDQTKGNVGLDSIYVDHMFIRISIIVAPPEPASNPSPPDGATDVAVDVDLSWTAGAGTESHDVYFGTTDPPAFAGNQSGTIFDPGTLVPGNTYYWSINELNSFGTTTGDVWSFTIKSSTGEVYVFDIEMSSKKAGKNYAGLATVWIKNDIGENVEGATVSGLWSGAVDGTASGVTGPDGKVILRSSNVDGGGTFTFTVMDVAASGYTYNEALNVETSDSITAP